MSWRFANRKILPHPLANYLLLLGRQFHHFYDHQRVLGIEADLSTARLGLIDAVRKMLQLGLGLFGRQRAGIDVALEESFERRVRRVCGRLPIRLGPRRCWSPCSLSAVP